MSKSSEDESKPNEGQRKLSLFQMGLGDEKKRKKSKNRSLKSPFTTDKVFSRKTNAIQEITPQPKEPKDGPKDREPGTSFDDLYYKESSKYFKKLDKAKKRSKDWEYYTKHSKSREWSLKPSRPKKRYMVRDERQRSFGDLYYKRPDSYMPGHEGSESHFSRKHCLKPPDSYMPGHKGSEPHLPRKHRLKRPDSYMPDHEGSEPFLPGKYNLKPPDSYMTGHQSSKPFLPGNHNLKHTKKERIEEILLDDEFEYLYGPPLVQPVLDQIFDPLVGLQHVCEIQLLDGRTVYECYLCDIHIPNTHNLKQHLTAVRHYMNFVKKYDLNCYSQILSCHEQGPLSHMGYFLKTEVLKIQDYIGQGKMIVKREKPKSGSYVSTSFKKGHREMRHKDGSRWAMKDGRCTDLPPQHVSSYSARPEVYPSEIEFSASSSDADSYYSGREDIFSGKKRNVRESSYTRTSHKTISRDDSIPVVASRRLYKKKAVKYWTAQECPSYDLREKLEKRRRTDTESSLSINTEPMPNTAVPTIMPNTPMPIMLPNPSMPIMLPNPPMPIMLPNTGKIVQPTFESIPVTTALDQMPLNTFLSLVISKLENTPIDGEEEEKLLLEVNMKSGDSLKANKAKKLAQNLQEAPAYILQKLRRNMPRNDGQGWNVLEDFKESFKKTEQDLLKSLEQSIQAYGMNSELRENSLQCNIEVEDVKPQQKIEKYEMDETEDIKIEENIFNIIEPDQEVNDDFSFFNNGSDKPEIARKLKNDLYHWYRIPSIPMLEQNSTTQPDSSVPDLKADVHETETDPSCAKPPTSKSPIVFP